MPFVMLSVNQRIVREYENDISLDESAGDTHKKGMYIQFKKKSPPTPWKEIGNSYGERGLKSQNFRSKV